MLALVAFSGSASAAVPASAIEEIDSFVEDKLEANGVPGAALAVVDGDRTVHERAFGKTGDGDEQVELDTPFITCSVTKSFTALAAVQLAERGKLDLDAPVSRYLPWFEIEPAADSEQVSVRTLLNQTSGLATEAGGAALRYLDDRSILETAEELEGETLANTPGREFEYANANYVLLGAVIEAASGRTYQSYLRSNVLEPLRMDHTYLDLGQAHQQGLAEGHRYWFGWTAEHTSYTTGLIPTGGVISTAPDMARYLRMMLNEGELEGRRVLSPRGIRTLTAPASAAEVGVWAKDPDVAYGMGWYVGGEPFGPEPAVFHPGGSPDFGAMAALLPERGQGMVLLYNVTPEVTLPGADGDVDRIAAGAVSILMGSDPAEGWSMHRYYVFFDLIALLLIGLATWALVRAIRVPPTPPASRASGVLRLLRAGLALLVGAILLLYPLLSGIGWKVLFLSVPDFALVVLVLGVLLVAVGALRLARLELGAMGSRT